MLADIGQLASGDFLRSVRIMIPPRPLAHARKRAGRRAISPAALIVSSRMALGENNRAIAGEKVILTPSLGYLPLRNSAV